MRTGLETELIENVSLDWYNFAAYRKRQRHVLCEWISSNDIWCKTKLCFFAMNDFKTISLKFQKKFIWIFQLSAIFHWWKARGWVYFDLLIQRTLKHIEKNYLLACQIFCSVIQNQQPAAAKYLHSHGCGEFFPSSRCVPKIMPPYKDTIRVNFYLVFFFSSK